MSGWALLARPQLRGKERGRKTASSSVLRSCAPVPAES